jgi:ABC-2 type transport system permease protein
MPIPFSNPDQFPDMNKIFLIIRREYLTRVRKRSFIVMTILGPILMASLFIVPAYLALKQEDNQVIKVVDETGRYVKTFTSESSFTFQDMGTNNIDSAKKTLSELNGYALLYIPRKVDTAGNNAIIYSDKQVSIKVLECIKDIMARETKKFELRDSIQSALLDVNPSYKPAGNANVADQISEHFTTGYKSDINLSTILIDENGSEKKSSTGASMVVGMVSGIMIYMFIFLFGVQVMRGVIEEKTNRIVEVIVSSVKPFQLMMGKIVGVAMVGLTQFILWIVFTATIIFTVQMVFADKLKMPTQQESSMKAVTNGSLQNAPEQQLAKDAENSNNEYGVFYEAISSVNYPVMIVSFIFYFLFGYLLYGALFAIVGSAVDNETDTQQFMLPITIPLILSIVMLQVIIMNPDGSLAFWLSMIPLTSPVTMMVRIPFGVPYWQIALSVGLLIAGFLFTTWLAARIYRTGILMYGKKVNYRELWKWIRYKG